MSKPRSLQRVFAYSDKGLAQLLNRAEALSELDRRIQRQLPPSLAGHVTVANLRDGILVLQTQSAEWRTRVHFLGPRLLETLRAEVPAITDIRLRVSPVSAPQAAAPVEGPRLSASSADILAKTAAATEDPRLRQALARLAARYRG